jgi:hypothetical protein
MAASMNEALAIPMVTITKKEYDELVEDQRFLECLRAGGVDNWEWWDEACAMFHEGDKNENPD